MSETALISLAVLCAALALSYKLSRHVQRIQQRACQRRDHALLQRCLDLLQALQKHRGLGAQLDSASVQQRAAVARHLDQLWLHWPDNDQLPALQQHWPQLRRKAADFDAHCRLIEALLTLIEQLEDHLYSHDQPAIRGLGEACRALEDLARLRGLSVRAANHSRCPPGLQMQLRFLCARLLDQPQEQALLELIAQLQSEVIEAAAISLSPSECFALLTPPIEQRLQQIRRLLD